MSDGLNGTTGRDQQLSDELGKLSSTQTLKECLAQVQAVLDIYQVGHGLSLHSLADSLAPDEALWRRHTRGR